MRNLLLLAIVASSIIIGGLATFVTGDIAILSSDYPSTICDDMVEQALCGSAPYTETQFGLPIPYERQVDYKVEQWKDFKEVNNAKQLASITINSLIVAAILLFILRTKHANTRN